MKETRVWKSKNGLWELVIVEGFCLYPILIDKVNIARYDIEYTSEIRFYTNSNIEIKVPKYVSAKCQQRIKRLEKEEIL